MNHILKLEEAGMLLMGCLMYAQLHLSWWIFLALFLLPDIGMLGYVFNPRTGALTYNLFHHRGIAVLLWVSGVVASVPALQVAGIIIFSHSCFDRILGYGLKYSDDFKHTHLGLIGPGKNKTV